MNRQLQVLKRITMVFFATAAALLVPYQTAQAQCPQTLNDIQWAAQSTPLTVNQLLNQGPMNCQTPIYFGLHRGAFTDGMDLNSSNQPIVPNLGTGTGSAQGLANPTVVISQVGTYPVYPQSIVSVAIPAYQNYISSNNYHLPANIDPTGTMTVQQGLYNAWPAIVELDPRQDSTGNWYLFHGVNTNSDALTPGVDPNDPNQSKLPTSQATLASDTALYRAVPLLGNYTDSGTAPAIDQMATVQQVLDQIMTDPNVNMVLQLHTRTYSDTLNFYAWLLQTWAPGHTNDQITNVVGRIFFCVDLNKLTPLGEGSNSNDYNNLSYLATWQTAVTNILSETHSMYPSMPIGSFPPLALMVNFYDDTNLYTQADVNTAFSLLKAAQTLTAVKYLGLEITDENSPINKELESLGQMAKSQLGMQIGKSVLVGSHFISVTDSNGEPAIKYGAIKSESPTQLITGNGSVINGTSFQTLWSGNLANLVDLNYSLSFQLGVQDTSGGSMGTYDPTDNTVTAPTQVQPTIVLSDLPLLHALKENGEVRTVFGGTYYAPAPSNAADPQCGVSGYPGCNDPNTPGQTVYTFCQSEGGICSFTGDRNVAFGANGNYLTQVVTNGPIACTLGNFGTPDQDPAPGHVKACYYSPPIPWAQQTNHNGDNNVGYVYCADEGEMCSYEGDAYGLMAANHKYSSTFWRVNQSYLCDVQTTFYYYGDPAKGFRKACFYAARQGYVFTHNGPLGYQFCAGGGSGNGRCQFKGPGRVAYGWTGYLGGQNFAFGVFNDGVDCNASSFVNPPPSTYTPDCYYQIVTAADSSTGSAATVTGGDQALISAMQDVPHAIWLSGDTPVNTATKITQVLAYADTQAVLPPTFVLYNIPNRDCGSYSAGGAQNTADYEAWIDAIFGAIGNSKVILLVEPDSLASIPSDCTTNPNNINLTQATADRFTQIQYAVSKFLLLPSGSSVYLDGGHSHYQAVPTQAARLAKAGVAYTSGFFSNVSNYNASDFEYAYDTLVSECLAFGQNSANGGWRLGNYSYCASQYFAQLNNPDGTIARYTVDPLNMSTWGPTYQWFTDNMGNAVATTHFVIDTSRNGQGRFNAASYGDDPYNQSAATIATLNLGSWCNSPGRGLGARPTNETGQNLLDAYLWVKTIGLSDGPCGVTGGARAWDYSQYTEGGWPTTADTQATFDPLWGVYDPPAGQWFAQQALVLATNAVPALVPAASDYPPPTSQWPSDPGNNNAPTTFCAWEGNTCYFTGTGNVFFGAPGQAESTYGAFTNSVVCETYNFPIDPNPGLRKACYIGPTY